MNGYEPSLTEPDFHCDVCGKETDTCSNPPERTICEDCCEDHDYRYEAEARGEFCVHCGKPAPEDCDDD